MQQANWQTRRDWRNGQIRPRFSRAGFWVLAIIFIAWTAMFVGINVAEAPRIEAALRRLTDSGLTRWDEALILPALLLVSVLMLPGLARSWRRMRLTRAVALSLQPYPGEIGGEVGGEVMLPFAHTGSPDVHVDLNCIEVTTHRRGKHTRRSETVRFRAPAKAQLFPSSRGTTVRFSAHTPPGLPESAVAPAGAYVYWAVRVRVPAQGFDEIFNIPVFATHRAARASHPPQPEIAKAALSSDILRVHRRGDDIALEYAPGRERNVARPLVLLGLVFSAAAVFLGYELYGALVREPVRYFEVAVLVLLAASFSLAGPALALAGLFMSRNRLTVTVSAGELVTVRHAFGLRWKRQAPLDAITRLEKRVASQSGQGAAADLNYAVVAHTADGRRISLGDGIPGTAQADALYALLEETLRPAAGPSDATPAIARPQWADRVLLWLKGFSWLVFAIVLGAFALDFFAR